MSVLLSTVEYSNSTFCNINSHTYVQYVYVYVYSTYVYVYVYAVYMYMYVYVYGYVYVYVYVYMHMCMCMCMCTCRGYSMAASAARYAITNLLYGAACPSLLPSSTMGEIDMLVSQIPDSVFFRVLDLASRAIILSRPRHCSNILLRSICILV